MIDAHVHLEKGDYSVEWIKQYFVPVCFSVVCFFIVHEH